MAKRKKKLLLSDLYPELAAEREVADERERERESEREKEEPVRKKSKRGRKPDEEKWKARLEVCKEWKRTKGRFPKVNRKDKGEDSLYNWLQECKPGGRKWTQWDAILEAVKLFKRTHGRFPRGRGGDAHETRLYKWLQANMDTTSHIYTHERANKLVLAFGDRWQSECFPKSIYAW